jgi:hypothetical protein
MSPPCRVLGYRGLCIETPQFYIKGLFKPKNLLPLYLIQNEVSACLECDTSQIARFSMSKMCHSQNDLFQHGWNGLWSNSSVSACLEYVIVNNVCFSMSVTCYCHIRFSMAGMYHMAVMCHGKNISFSIARITRSLIVCFSFTLLKCIMVNKSVSTLLE